MAEYVWIGGTGADLRSKCRTLMKKVGGRGEGGEETEGGPAAANAAAPRQSSPPPPHHPPPQPASPADLPRWNYDGSSTGQAPGDDSEVMIIPRAIYADPFRGGDNILVMCDSYEPNKPGQGAGELKPIPTNTRYACAKFCDAAKAEEPWFGIEQEYTLLNTHTKWPLGWPTSGYPGPQGETGEGERVARAARSFFLPSTRPPPPHAFPSRLSRPLLLLRGRGRGDRARHH